MRNLIGSGPAVAGWLLGTSLLGAAAAHELAPAKAPLALAECRLEHPLGLMSVQARCGRLRVPLDYSGQEPGELLLRVAVVPAVNRRSARAPLFILAGGPGQGAVDLYLSLAPAFARINREHDIVLIDQRGTGGSSPLQCDYADDWQGADPGWSRLRTATEQCLRQYGAQVRFYTSSAAVEDLAAARSALRYATLDLYGSSYGTRVAQQYMRHYPSTVHAAILDGVLAPEETIGPATALYGEQALQAIVTRCAAARPCATAYPQLAPELESLRQRFAAQNLDLTLPDPTSSLPLTVAFGREMLSASLRFLSYSAPEAALLPDLIHRGAEGTLAPLAAQTIINARAVHGQLASGMQNSIICSEDEPYFGDSGIARTRLQATYQGTDQIDAFTQVCKIWPRGRADADLHQPLRSSVPTLLLSGELDPVTPPAEARRAARGLMDHKSLVLVGEGHGQIATACVPRLAARFLEAAAAETLDASCLEGHRAEPFFVSSNGPTP